MVPCRSAPSERAQSATSVMSNFSVVVCIFVQCNWKQTCSLVHNFTLKEFNFQWIQTPTRNTTSRHEIILFVYSFHSAATFCTAFPSCSYNMILLQIINLYGLQSCNKLLPCCCIWRRLTFRVVLYKVKHSVHSLEVAVENLVGRNKILQTTKSSNFHFVGVICVLNTLLTCSMELKPVVCLIYRMMESCTFSLSSRPKICAICV